MTCITGRQHQIKIWQLVVSSHVKEEELHVVVELWISGYLSHYVQLPFNALHQGFSYLVLLSVERPIDSTVHTLSRNAANSINTHLIGLAARHEVRAVLQHRKVLLLQVRLSRLDTLLWALDP